MEFKMQIQSFKTDKNFTNESIKILDKNSFSTETLKCPVCGNTYEKNSKGRTREYCSTTCQEFNKFKNAMIDKMKLINFCDFEARLIRREFWGYANIAKIKNKVKKC
jgi:hypothetical protein